MQIQFRILSDYFCMLVAYLVLSKVKSEFITETDLKGILYMYLIHFLLLLLTT